MKRIFQTAMALAIIMLPALSVQGASGVPGLPVPSGSKILFIGNSITDKWGPMPNNVKKILSILAPSVTITTTGPMGMGGGNLNDYIDGKAGDILGAIKTGGYKYVVVQPYQDSYAPKVAPHTKASFFASCRTFNTAITAAGGKMVLWSVHGYNSDDRMDYLRISPANCQEIAKELKCIYAMTCEAWDSITRVTKDNFLWEDIIHQGPDGSAMYAMLMYSVLMDGANTVGVVDNWFKFVEGGGLVGTRTVKYQDVMEKVVMHFAKKSIAFSGGTVGVAPASARAASVVVSPAVGLDGNAVRLTGVETGARVEILDLSGRTIAAFVHDGSLVRHMAAPLSAGAAVVRINSGRALMATHIATNR